MTDTAPQDPTALDLAVAAPALADPAAAAPDLADPTIAAPELAEADDDTEGHVMVWDQATLMGLPASGVPMPERAEPAAQAVPAAPETDTASRRRWGRAAGHPTPATG